MVLNICITLALCKIVPDGTPDRNTGEALDLPARSPALRDEGRAETFMQGLYDLPMRWQRFSKSSGLFSLTNKIPRSKSLEVFLPGGTSNFVSKRQMAFKREDIG